MKHQLGLTLLEVSIAMSIGMAILLMATKSVEYLNRYNATHEVKSEVALLRLALEEYYFNNCHEYPFPQPTIDILKDNKYLPAQFNADNDFGSPYTVYISNTFLNYRSTTKEPPSYTIALSLHDGLSKEVYQQRLGATDTGQHFYLKESAIAALDWSDIAEGIEGGDDDIDARTFEVERAIRRPTEVGDDTYHWSYSHNFRGRWVQTYAIYDTVTLRDENLRWTYPLTIKKQYGDNSQGQFKRFYSHLKEFSIIPSGGRGRLHDEICTPNRLKRGTLVNG